MQLKTKSSANPENLSAKVKEKQLHYRISTKLECDKHHGQYIKEIARQKKESQSST